MQYAHFFEEYLHLLANLGWHPEPTALSPAAKRSLKAIGFEVDAIHTLQTEGGTLALVRLEAHQLPEPAAVVGAFVETTWEVHGLLSWCARTLEAEAALLIDPAVAWLHRLRARDHCLVCLDGDMVEDRLLPLFAGGGDPVASILAWQRESPEALGRGLRQWLQLWERRLGEACHLDMTQARRLIRQLILARKARELGWVRARDGMARALDRPLDLLCREDTDRAPAQALRAVDLLGRTLGLAPCERGPTERHRTEEALARSELAAAALLRSIELLSGAQLTARVWLAAEAEPDLQQRSWRLSIEDPDPLRRPGVASPHEAPRLRLDVLDVGYEYILCVVESALRWVVTYNASLAQEYAATGRRSFQPDFLSLAQGGVDLSGTISDPIHFALSHLVEVVATLPSQNRLVKWLLTLRFLELADELDLALDRLPDLDHHC
jgi:hypothetical protein